MNNHQTERGWNPYQRFPEPWTSNKKPHSRTRWDSYRLADRTSDTCTAASPRARPAARSAARPHRKGAAPPAPHPHLLPSVAVSGAPRLKQTNKLPLACLLFSGDRGSLVQVCMRKTISITRLVVHTAIFEHAKCKTTLNGRRALAVALSPSGLGPTNRHHRRSRCREGALLHLNGGIVLLFWRVSGRNDAAAGDDGRHCNLRSPFRRTGVIGLWCWLRLCCVAGVWTEIERDGVYRDLIQMFATKLGRTGKVFLTFFCFTYWYLLLR